jgi:multidrug efflux pump subunit AcrA (membrane-fusion protein)
VRVSLDLATHPNALVVPPGAVTDDLNDSYVFVVDDKNIAIKRAVTRGLSNGDRVELLSGVKAGEQVVTVGQFRLRGGDTVKVVPASVDAKAAG